MERRTLFVALGLLAVLGVAAVAGLSTTGADLEERWISDTPRDNRVNHHPVAVGPEGHVYAPVAEVAGDSDMDETACSLVRLDPTSGAVEWRWSVPPANCTSHAITGPTLADVDGDGSTAVLVATTERALHAIDGASGREEFRVALETYGYGPPAAVDLRDGPDTVVVVSDIGGSVSLVENRSVRWRRDLDGSTWAAPIVADLTGTGTPEIVVGTSDRVVALSPAGEQVWTTDADAVSVVLADDGTTPLVIAAESGAVRGLDGASGDVVWNHTGSWTATVGAVGAGETGATVYTGLSGGRVIALDARTGDRLWLTPLLRAERRSPTPEPVLGDVDGDERGELVAVTGTGSVAVLDPADGRVLARYDRDVPILTHATVADVTGDGAAEVFVRYGDGRVVSLAYG